jgi:hypothetical protein
MDLRKGPRAQLRMPVRLRWQGSLGMRLEITETLDVSKEGMLVRRSDSHGVGSRVWLAFPFDPTSAAAAQPETPAQVVRVEPETAGGYRWSAAGLHVCRSRYRFACARRTRRGRKNR